MQSTATHAIDAFRQAILTARQLDSELGAGTDVDSEVSELRQKIEVCENEGDALALLKKLAPLEQTSKLRQIRKTRLQNDSATAWQNAASLVRPSVDECADAVGRASDGAYDCFLELVVSAIAPEAMQLAETAPSIAHQINYSNYRLAPNALGVAPANLAQNELTLAGRRDHYQTAKQYAENALTVIDTITASLPEIRRQADLLRRASDAFAAVLKADGRQIAA